MGKIAHIQNGTEQSIQEHLINVAHMASEFAADYAVEGVNASQYAYETGLFHDIGKYSDQFQSKIRGNDHISVDHSTAGAREMAAGRMPAAAFAIAGHHGGLPNGKDTTEQNLIYRVKKKELEEYGEYRQEIALEPVSEPKLKGFREAFFTRMIYSALVDADFLDTENFMQQGSVCRSGYDTYDVLYERFQNYIAPWLDIQPDTKELNVIRTGILKQCIEKGRGKRGLYSLTVPTGGGKTISSMAFAMEQVKANHMKRIIYVIPYTSIIEQNAKIFGEILGRRNVLEHHSNVSMVKKENADDLELHQLSTENWDAPVVVTTNVQFFESLFANKSSKCRKLHNIANSVVIFDEAQMIPLNYLKPCVSAIEELVASYRVTAVLCTATQPALDPWFQRLQIEEISNDFEMLFQKLKRTTVTNMGKMSEEQLLDRIAENKQVLTIVNRKSEAQKLFQQLHPEGAFHLSTYMTPGHRRRVIDEIKRRLKEGEDCRVISTSLVEAGVDIDFPTVFREQAGLDSIIQAAGRCNREGRRKIEECETGVFELEGEQLKLIAKNISIMQETSQKFQEYDSLEAIHYYFETLQLLDEEFLDQKQIIRAFETDLDGIKMPFQEVGQRFRLIDADTKRILIPKEERAQELVGLLEEQKEQGYSMKDTMRELNEYSLNVFDYEYQKILDQGDIYEVFDGVAVLQNLQLYTDEMGLCTEGGDGLLMY